MKKKQSEEKLPRGGNIQLANQLKARLYDKGKHLW